MRTKVAGHRLEIVSVRGGLVASCACGEVYKHPSNGVQPSIFGTYKRDLIRTLHRAHVGAL